MSETNERKLLADAFLRIAYEINMGQSGTVVRLEQVAEYVPPELLGTTTATEYESALSSAGKYLSQKGLLEALDESKTSGPSMFKLTREGIDEVEGRNEPQQPNVTFNIESSNFYQSAIGTHNTNSFTGDFDFSTVERHIEEDAEPDDREELRALVAEVKDLLDNGQSANKGFLARWNDKFQKYDWLRGAVAGWLLNFGTQVIAGG